MMREMSYYEYKKLMGIDQSHENKLREITYGDFISRFFNSRNKALQIEGYRTVVKPDGGKYLPLEWTFAFDLANSVTYAFVTDLYRLEAEIPHSKKGYFFKFRGITDDFSKFHGKKFEILYQKIYDKIFTTPVIPIQEENKDTPMTMEDLEKACDCDRKETLDNLILSEDPYDGMRFI
jgi:hypothetical protein